MVDRIDLAKPDFPGIGNIGPGSAFDISRRTRAIASRCSTPPTPSSHRRVFRHRPLRPEFPRVRLSHRSARPRPAWPGCRSRPTGKTALHHVISTASTAIKPLRILAFDLTRIRARRPEFRRSRFSFGMSANGKKLYIYGAGFEIEVYDAVTLKLERTLDLHNDVTMGGVIVAR